MADHVHDAGITVNAEGDRDDAKISCNAALVFEIDGRVTNRTDQEVGVSHGPLQKSGGTKLEEGCPRGGRSLDDGSQNTPSQGVKSDRYTYSTTTVSCGKNSGGDVFGLESNRYQQTLSFPVCGL